MTTKWLKPKADVLVRYENPARGHIPPDGDEILMTSYYRRRVADGDLVPGKRPAAPKNEETK